MRDTCILAYMLKFDVNNVGTFKINFKYLEAIYVAYFFVRFNYLTIGSVYACLCIIRIAHFCNLES